jgi:hypothetical protein
MDRPHTSMKHLSRSTIRPSTPKPRVLLIRQPVKSVRPSDQPDRTPMRLAISVVSCIGGLLVIWLMGYLGFRLGFAPLARVPDLMISPGGALAMGASMVASAPRSILEAGLIAPAWLMLGFALIAIPAAGLSAAKPIKPGRVRPATVYVVLAVIAAVAGAVNGAALIWWTLSAQRANLLNELPFQPTDVAAWLSKLQTVSGLDLLALASAVVWVVLTFRLPIPIWLRALATTFNLLAFVVVIVAASVSSAAVAGVTADRSLGLIDTGTEERLLIGSTEHDTASIIVVGSSTLVELRDRPDVVTILGKQSIVRFLERHAEP